MGPWFIFGQEISNLKSYCRITLYSGRCSQTS